MTFWKATYDLNFIMHVLLTISFIGFVIQGLSSDLTHCEMINVTVVTPSFEENCLKVLSLDSILQGDGAG